MQPYFRDAVQDDIPALAAILISADGGPRVDSPAQLGPYHDALAEIDRTDGSYLLVAEYDGETVAVAHLTTFRRFHHRVLRHAELSAILVAKRFGNSHVDGLLLEHAVERARDLGCQRVVALTNASPGSEHTLLERHGFFAAVRGYERVLWSISSSDNTPVA